MSFFVALLIAINSILAPQTLSLPQCENEDGFGVALCRWDGIVSGDCPADYVGSLGAEILCLQKHSENPSGVMHCVELFNLDEIPSIEPCLREV